MNMTPSLDIGLTVRRMRVGDQWHIGPRFTVKRKPDSGVRGRTPTERVYVLSDKQDGERKRWGDAKQIAEDVAYVSRYGCLPPAGPRGF